MPKDQKIIKSPFDVVTEPEAPKMPDHIQRVDFVVVERQVLKNGVDSISIKVDSTDPEYLKSVSSFELAGVIEAAKVNMLNKNLRPATPQEVQS